MLPPVRTQIDRPPPRSNTPVGPSTLRRVLPPPTGPKTRPLREHAFRSDTIRRLISELFVSSDFRQQLGQELWELVMEDFADKSLGGRDAWGEEWEPLAASTIAGKGDDVIMIRTGDLNNAIRWEVLSDGIRIFIDPRIKYAIYQHFGTRTIPARPLLPSRDQLSAGLPRKWRTRLTSFMVSYIRTHLPQRLQSAHLKGSVA